MILLKLIYYYDCDIVLDLLNLLVYWASTEIIVLIIVS